MMVFLRRLLPRVVNYHRVGFAVTGGPEHSPAYNLEFFGRGSDYANKASFDNANGSLYMVHFRLRPSVAYI